MLLRMLMGRIAIIVPVSVHEPINTLVKSAQHLKGLDSGDHQVKILYIFDGDEKDERVTALRESGVDVLARNTNRGKRAGAINDGLEFLKKYRPDFVAIFDADSRPSRRFVVECIRKMRSDVFISSAKREIINPYTYVAEGVFIEYKLIGSLLRISGFRQFNGLIGVLNQRYLFRYRLNENCMTEDADFSTRMHSLGLRAELCDGALFEQAPVKVEDFISQRKRWYYGGMELWKYFSDVISSGNPKFVISWIMALTLTYFPLLFLIPSLLTLPSLVIRYGIRGIRVYVGLITYIFILQYSAISAMLSFARKESIEWRAIGRVE